MGVNALHPYGDGESPSFVVMLDLWQDASAAAEQRMVIHLDWGSADRCGSGDYWHLCYPIP